MLTSIRRTLDARAVLIAAVVAGTVFLVVNLALTALLFDIGPGLMMRYIAALVLGEAVLTGPTDAGVIVTALLVHFALSVLFTLLITIAIHRWGLLVGILGGGMLGLAVYAINLYTLTLFFEWFSAINNPALAFSHIVFGMVAGGVYELFDHYDLPLTTNGGRQL